MPAFSAVTRLLAKVVGSRSYATGDTVASDGVGGAPGETQGSRQVGQQSQPKHSGPPTGPAAFSLASAICGVPIQPDELAHRFGASGCFGIAEMLRAAKALGLRARATTPPLSRLASTPMPVVARDRSGHYFIIGRVGLDAKGAPAKLMIQRPGGPPFAVTSGEFTDLWDGALVMIARKLALADPNRPFGISWFFEAVLRYRRILAEVLLDSFALQLLGLATPLFFQVIVDKVLVHH
ncbi:MAG TPA: cysteine peptidase family C39 domain-containing protein, partial [Caulobacteraceae bacterium]